MPRRDTIVDVFAEQNDTDDAITAVRASFAADEMRALSGTTTPPG